MKTLHSISMGGLALIVAAASIEYAVHTTTRMQKLERRLERTEALLQSCTQSLASTERVRNLEERVQRAELASSHVQLGARSGPPGLEQRIQKVEQRIKPHLEMLPPYVPEK